MDTPNTRTPTPFLLRRLHSFAGLLFVIFLIEHLLTNSQAALWITSDGAGFISAVNAIHNLPYLPVIEIIFLAAPILTHMLLGIHYLFQAAPNAFPSDGTRPSLNYAENRAYTWQRITSWILLVLVVYHVVDMRFEDYPDYADGRYLVRIGHDEGLDTLAERLNVQLFTPQKIETEQELLKEIPTGTGVEGRLLDQKREEKGEFVQELLEEPLERDQVIASAPDFGTASLLVVRETFKMPLMIAIYTVFVLAAAYHGFNGLWTFLITWGISLNPRTQRQAKIVCHVLMATVALLGLSAVWLTFWVTLRY